MPVLLHTGVWATIQRRMTQRTHRAAATHKQSNGTRQRLRLLQRKKYRNCLILANNRLRLLPALQKNLDGGRNQRQQVAPLIIPNANLAYLELKRRPGWKIRR